MEAVMPLIAEGLGRRYRRSRPWALRDVDLAIPAGSVAALVGPNGAGKSTLIRSWMGFERPDRGRVLVCGKDPSEDRSATLRSLGYVPQSASLYRAFTVADHYRFATVHRPEFDRQYALDRTHALGIDPDRFVKDLSGGEQAQIALALALGTRAPILLLDEPLASLDPLARREFLAVLVEELRSTGGTAVLSSHVVTDIEQVCDWLVVISGGQVALSLPISKARLGFRTLWESRLGQLTPIGTFVGPGGGRLSLVQSDDPTIPEATLEEIVLGHIAASRTSLAA